MDSTRVHRGALALRPLRFVSTVLLALAAVLLGACENAAGPKPPTVHTLTPVDSSVAAYHTLVLRVPAELARPAPSDEPLPGVVGSDTVWLFASGDTAVAGLLPDLGDGTRTLSVEFGPKDVGEATFTAVPPPVVADPEGALEELSTAIASMVATMTADSAQDETAEAAQLFAAELNVVMGSMTPDQKRQFAEFLASYPAELAALGLETFGGRKLASPAQVLSLGRAASIAGSLTMVEVGGILRTLVSGFFDVLDFIAKSKDSTVKSAGSWWDANLAKAGQLFGSLSVLARYEQLKAEWEQVEFFPLKPGPAYRDLIAALGGNSSISPGWSVAAQVESSTTPETGPFTFYNGAALSLGVAHTYETLQLTDQSAAAGDTRVLLDALIAADAWWLDTRLLLEQIARDLGQEVSLKILDLPNPRLRNVYGVPGSVFTLGQPSNAHVTCSAAGSLELVLTCSTGAEGDQEFTVEATYDTDFGPQTLRIQGVLYQGTNRVERVSGNGQTAYPGDPLNDPIGVRVTKVADGAAVSGAVVRWSVAAGGGTVTAAESSTDVNGYASVSWTLGATEGEQTLQAEASVDGDAIGTLVFTATADRGAMLQKLSGDGQTGTADERLSAPLVVRVADSQAKPVVGVTVEWTVTQGDGSLSAATTSTDANGEASVTWTLGSDSTGTVEAAVRDAAGAHIQHSPVAFTAGPATSAGVLTQFIAAGNSYACGITTSGEGYCWGKGDWGQLGNGISGSYYTSTTPVRVSGGLNFATISTAYVHSCGVTTSGAAYCWGSGGHGKLGGGSTAHASTPAPVSGGLTFETVTTATIHSCGISTSGAAYCWGGESSAPRYDVDGVLGTGNAGGSDVPVPVSGNLTFTAISGGSLHTCGVTTSGAAYCWGEGQYGRLGNGSTADALAPVRVGGDLTFNSVSAGFQHSCGITTSGAAYCWGWGNNGELGNGKAGGYYYESTPVAVSGGITFATITAGTDHTCGMATSGAGYCWGDGYEGELGNGATNDSNIPVLVSGGLDFAAISAGHDHNCGITTSGSAYCWGDGEDGALGSGTTDRSNIPVLVSGGLNFGWPD